MTTPINNANFSTQPVVKERKADAQPTADDRVAASADGRPDRADLTRGQQVLARQVEQGALSSTRAPIDSMAEARDRIAALKQAIQDHPKAAVKAQGLIDHNIFEAASARPNA